MRTLILGLGNPLLGDDGVGWRVADQVAKLVGASSGSPFFTSAPEVDYHAGGGLSLMERLVGYDRAIIIDAMNLGQEPLGTVSSLRLEELEDLFAGHLASTHETNLQTALELGKSIGVQLPKDIFIIAIESSHVYDFSETLSPPVDAAVPLAVRRVLEKLED